MSKRARLCLSAVLMLALALRIHVIATHIYVAHPDETFQYFEQAHRLTFGSGFKPWEFFDGARSWLLPGILALVMRLASAFGSEPMLYVLAARACCATFSLTVVYVGFRYALQRDGLRAAIITGFLCAIWFELIYFAPVVMNEVLAAHCTIWAVYLCDTASTDEQRAQLRLVFSGALFGLAAYMRLQYVPALALAVIWQQQFAWRRYLWLGLGALVSLTISGGLLDTLTLGTPFQSIWLNLFRNSLQGVSSVFGKDPWYYFVLFEGAAWSAAAGLGIFVLVGAGRAPLLALICAVVVLVHSVVPHKEYRFIYLAISYVPILMGLGMSAVISWIESRSSVVTTRICVTGLLLSAVAGSWFAADNGFISKRWHLPGDNIQAFLAANRQPDICGLGVKISWVWSGGYTYLNREVPIYLSDYHSSDAIPGVTIPLEFALILHNQIVPQYPGDGFSANASRYNYLVAAADRAEAGFSPVVCFRNRYNPDQPREVCLLRRPGGCSQ